MAKFHISPDGMARPCHAGKGENSRGCRYGYSDAEHFETLSEAKIGAEKKMKEENGGSFSTKNTKKPVVKKLDKNFNKKCVELNKTFILTRKLVKQARVYLNHDGGSWCKELYDHLGGENYEKLLNDKKVFKQNNANNDLERSFSQRLYQTGYDTKYPSFFDKSLEKSVKVKINFDDFLNDHLEENVDGTEYFKGVNVEGDVDIEEIVENMNKNNFSSFSKSAPVAQMFSEGFSQIPYYQNHLKLPDERSRDNNRKILFYVKPEKKYDLKYGLYQDNYEVMEQEAMIPSGKLSVKNVKKYKNHTVVELV